MSTDDNDQSTDGNTPSYHKTEATAPAWMVTYADLMSLLFALFVLLLSFSEVNSDSFKKNAGPMREAFNQNSDFQTDQEARKSGGLGILPGVREIPMNVPDEEILRRQMVEKLQINLQRDLANNLVEMIENSNGVTLRFPSKTSFVSGGADLSAQALATLDKIIPILSRTPGDIQVGGHTDDIPISTLQFRSNWDLSTARATSVVHYFLRSGQIPKQRLTSQGYADARPLVPNDSEENRARNRRVEVSIVISSETAKKQAKKQEDRKTRIWTVHEGERELEQGAEPISEKERRQRARDASPYFEEERQKAREAQEKKAREENGGVTSIGR